MGAIETNIFQTAEGVAVQPPEALGIAPGTPVAVERVGDMIEIRPLAGDADNPATLGARLREIWKDAPANETRFRREPIEFLNRPGLAVWLAPTQ